MMKVLNRVLLFLFVVIYPEWNEQTGEAIGTGKRGSFQMSL